METREKNFTLRFSLRARLPENLLESDDFDEDGWMREWESIVKPGLLRAVFSYLRSIPSWEAHIRNRGIPVGDEIEIVAERIF